jgi:glutathione synthase/RimK-type ligase-like ATP-grasp enzyme
VGQTPDKAEDYDEKWFTNAMLHSKGLSIPNCLLVSAVEANALTPEFLSEKGLETPWVIKPVHGRGS